MLQDRVRKAIESTYTDTCSVIEQKKEKVRGVVETKDEIVLENQPCKLSFETGTVAGATDAATTIAQITKLFIAPEIEIKSGSKIVVERCGKMYLYTKSGVPAVYETHQEVMLELFERYA